MNNYTGNKNASSDFLRVLIALKKNTMFDTHVADVCRVSQINDDTYVCTSITDGSMISAIPVQGMTLNLQDIVLVIFTDLDFRANLKLLKQNQVVTPLDSPETYHSKAFGIITNIIYSGVKDSE